MEWVKLSCPNFSSRNRTLFNQNHIKTAEKKKKPFFSFPSSPVLLFLLVEWKQQQKRFPFPLWGSICKEHYVMNWKLSYNVFVCRKETLIYTKKKEKEREREIGIHWKVESFVNWKKASILLPPFHYYCCRDQDGRQLPFAYLYKVLHFCTFKHFNIVPTKYRL